MFFCLLLYPSDEKRRVFPLLHLFIIVLSPSPIEQCKSESFHPSSSLTNRFSKGMLLNWKKIWRFQRAWMELLDQRGKLISFRQQTFFFALQHCFSRKSNPCNYPLNSRLPTPPLPKNNPVLLVSSPSSFLPPPQTIFLLPSLSLSGSGKNPPWGQQRGKEGLQGGWQNEDFSPSPFWDFGSWWVQIWDSKPKIRNLTLQGIYFLHKIESMSGIFFASDLKSGSNFLLWNPFTEF